MLFIPTYVAPSRISGMGLFAATPLASGTRVWEYTEGVDWRIRPGELERFPEPFQAWLRHYLYLDDDGVYVLCGDNAKFMNHDSNPNCSDVDTRFTVTVRPVHAGEELTCDYREFDRESRERGLIWALAVPPAGPQRPETG